MKKIKVDYRILDEIIPLICARKYKSGALTIKRTINGKIDWSRRMWWLHLNYGYYGPDAYSWWNYRHKVRKPSSMVHEMFKKLSKFHKREITAKLSSNDYYPHERVSESYTFVIINCIGDKT